MRLMLPAIVMAALFATPCHSAPGTAIVLDADTRADVRCVAALSHEAGEASEAGKATKEQISRLSTMLFYFVGRIDGRMPKLHVGAAFEQEASQMSHTEYLTLRQACRAQYELREKKLNSPAQAAQN